MSCLELSETCLYAGSSFFDYGLRIVDLAGVPIDITGFDFDYCWLRVGDTVAAISLDETDTTEVTVGAGVDDNQVTIALTGADTAVTPGTYYAWYTVNDTAGNVWVARRKITVKPKDC